MKKLFLLFSIVFIALIAWTYSFGAKIDFERESATAYAAEHCGTGGKPYNPDYESFGNKDCANFVSQVLIDWGFDF
jgi:hypothetical protein